MHCMVRRERMVLFLSLQKKEQEVWALLLIQVLPWARLINQLLPNIKNNMEQVMELL